MLRRTVLCAAPLLAIVFAPPARGDTVAGTKNYESVTEAKHEIDLKIDRGHATLTVRRTFRNAGPKHDQAMVHITDLPLEAVATGLRTLAMKDGKPIWYAGELMEAEAAAKKYRELTGIGGYYPKDPALLSWRSQGHLALQVFPIDPGGTKTVEYTLEVPTHYVEGHDVLELPAMGVAGRLPMVTIAAQHADDPISIGGGKVTAGTLFPLSKGASISVARTNAPKLGGNYASFFFGKGRALMHTSFELAPKLSEVPKGAFVVVLLDASRSLTDAERKAEVAAARAYVGHFTDPGTQVAIVAFARNAKPRAGGFVSSKDALADLAKLTLAGENGSAIDAAFVEATRLLAAAPAKAPRRIVAITDFRTRNALTPQVLSTLTLATGATVHLATIESGTDHLVRDDDDRWAAAARNTGGLLWRATAPTTVASARVFEEWARPLRVDRLAMAGVGLPADGLGLPSSMHEGEGFEDLRIASFAAPTLAISGEMWSTKTSIALSPTEEQNRLWSALVFGSAAVNDLTDPEMMTLAMKGRAVSPVTSYLAIEPGVRPSTEGLEWSESFGVGGLGLSGIGSGGAGSGYGTGLPAFDRMGHLQKALATALSKCGAEGRTATLRLETTLTEIVSASTTALSGPKDGAIERCIEEAGWALTLPTRFDHDWAVYDVKLGKKP